MSLFAKHLQNKFKYIYQYPNSLIETSTHSNRDVIGSDAYRYGPSHIHHILSIVYPSRAWIVLDSFFFTHIIFFLRFIGGADSDTEVSVGQADGNYSLYLH
jgi:hypothetical protein